MIITALGQNVTFGCNSTTNDNVALNWKITPFSTTNINLPISAQKIQIRDGAVLVVKNMGNFTVTELTLDGTQVYNRSQVRCVQSVGQIFISSAFDNSPFATLGIFGKNNIKIDNNTRNKTKKQINKNKTEKKR